jgi:hypothetical protein
MDLVGAAIGVLVIQDGVEAGQAGARAEKQREEQEGTDAHAYAASLTSGSARA